MPRTPNLDSDQREAVDVLASAERVLLASHVRPDGDGIGSEAALARVLAKLGKEVLILNPDPPSERFDFFTEGLTFGVFQGGEVPAHDVSVLLDISELSRCGDLGESIGRAGSRKMVVDHHIHPGDEWWDHAFVDVTASATGLLVYRIARSLGVELDRLAATAIFASIVSDTGWFKYSNTDAETLEATADLVRCGVQPFEVYRLLHQREVPEQPAWIASLLARTEYHAEGRLALIALPKSEVDVGERVDSDFVLDVLRSVETIEVVVFVRELVDGNCKVSLRSKTDFDVNAIARQFGGGGHRKASGATIPKPLEVARQLLVDATLADLGATATSEESSA